MYRALQLHWQYYRYSTYLSILEAHIPEKKNPHKNIQGWTFFSVKIMLEQHNCVSFIWRMLFRLYAVQCTCILSAWGHLQHFSLSQYQQLTGLQRCWQKMRFIHCKILIWYECMLHSADFLTDKSFNFKCQYPFCFNNNILFSEIVSLYRFPIFTVLYYCLLLTQQLIHQIFLFSTFLFFFFL